MLRVALGLVLAAAALAVVLLPRPGRLEISVQLEEAAPPDSAAKLLASVRPGQTARLKVALKPGEGAPRGAALICDQISRPLVRAEAPEGLVFERAVEHLQTPEESVGLVFTVDRRAHPGPRTVKLFAEAELSAEGRAMRLSASASREVTVTVTVAGAEK
jgi:hypothetical protein